MNGIPVKNQSVAPVVDMTGKADEKDVAPPEVNQEELQKGIEVEMEHTKDRALATKIAMDHLSEIPDYYSRLLKMEEEAKNGGGDSEMLGEEENGESEIDTGDEGEGGEGGDAGDGGDEEDEEEEEEEKPVGAIEQTSDESLENFMGNMKRKRMKKKMMRGKPNMPPEIEE